MPADHQYRHRAFHEGCYLCKLRSVSIAPAALPTRQDVRYTSTDQLEKGWQRDIPAYRRLVADGIQPPQVDGCADAEARAETKEQIETETYAPIVQGETV